MRSTVSTWRDPTYKVILLGTPGKQNLHGLSEAAAAAAPNLG